PVLLPVLALSVLPQAWASLRSARVGYDVALQTVTAKHRLWITADLLANRSSAAELRVLTAEGFLLREYRRLARNLELVQIRLGYTRTRYELFGRAATGLGFATTYAGLAWLLVTGRSSPGA